MHVAASIDCAHTSSPAIVLSRDWRRWGRRRAGDNAPLLYPPDSSESLTSTYSWKIPNLYLRYALDPSLYFSGTGASSLALAARSNAASKKSRHVALPGSRLSMHFQWLRRASFEFARVSCVELLNEFGSNAAFSQCGCCSCGKWCRLSAAAASVRQSARVQDFDDLVRQFRTVDGVVLVVTALSLIHI